MRYPCEVATKPVIGVQKCVDDPPGGPLEMERPWLEMWGGIRTLGPRADVSNG